MGFFKKKTGCFFGYIDIVFHFLVSVIIELGNDIITYNER